MAIMVDESLYPFRGQLYCHMMSTLTDRTQAEQELHAFADRLGLKRGWFQGKDPRHPHYDLSPGKRAQAVKSGALEVTNRAMIFMNPFGCDIWGTADVYCCNCYWYGHHSDLPLTEDSQGDPYNVCPRCFERVFGDIAKYDGFVPF